MFIKCHGGKILCLALALILGIILLHSKFNRKEKQKEETNKVTFQNDFSSNEESSIIIEDTFQGFESSDELSLDWNEDNSIFSDDDWHTIKKYCKSYTKKEVASVLARFDKKITSLPEKSEKITVLHNFGDDLKDFTRSYDKLSKKKFPHKIENISVKSIYNIYNNLRRYAIILLISNSRVYEYENNNKIISMFVNLDIFFKDTIYEKEHIIFQKIKIYIYFIVFF